MLGHGPLGMFSFAVDQLWHSHVLASHLWAQFCLEYHGQMINHVPQVPVPSEMEAVICTTCQSCRNCSGGGQGCEEQGANGFGLHGSRGTAQEFSTAYFQAFGIQPSPVIWSLNEAEGCATD
jgi:hypothetical protein